MLFKIILLCVCGVCTCVCTGAYTHACVEARGGCLVSCPITLHPNLSLRPGARLAVSKPEILPLLPQHWGYKSLCAQLHSAFYMGAADLNLGFQSCAASVLTHGAMASTSLFISHSPLEDAQIHFSYLKSIKAN